MSRRGASSPGLSWVLVGAGALLGVLAVQAGPYILIIPVVVGAFTLIYRNFVSTRRDPLAPSVVFPAAMLVYFLVGASNLYESSSPHMLQQPIPGRVWAYVVLGLAGFLLGERIAGRLGLRRRAVTELRGRPLGFVVAGAVAMVVIGLFSLAAVNAYYGIPLVDISIRSEVSGYFTYLTFLIWAGVLLVAAHVIPRQPSVDRKRVILALSAAIASLVALALAYRTPATIVLLTSVFLYHLSIKRLTTARLASVFLVVALLGASFALYRSASQHGEASIDRNYLRLTGGNVSGLMLPVQTLYWMIFRESVSNFTAMLDIIPERQPYFMGRAMGGSLLSALPGKQITVREWVSILIYGDAHSTLTPTILGPFYMDFGPLGVFLGMAIVGGILGYLYARRFLTPLNGLLYAYWLAVSLVSIHSGLADPALYAFVPAVFVGVTWAGAPPMFIVQPRNSAVSYPSRMP